MRFWGMFRFTLSEAMRKGTLLFYFGIATLILLVLSLGIGRQPSDQNVITFFGKPLILSGPISFNAIEFLLIQLHSLSSFWIILFGVLGVAGLIPEMLEKGTIDLFLSKPLSRMELLFARALGSAMGMSVNMIYFIFGVWCIFGLKLGVWNTGFLASSIYLTYAFLCLFSVVTIAGLITRSAGFSIMLTFAFTIIAWGLELREKGLYMLWDNTLYHRFLDGLYYGLPQFDAMLANCTRIIGKNPFNATVADFTFMPFVYSFFSSCLLYGLSLWYFSRQDY
jgi:ABC-type transport system involved in multi-copper enzyme maturation permease subunit